MKYCWKFIFQAIFTYVMLKKQNKIVTLVQGAFTKAKLDPGMLSVVCGMKGNTVSSVSRPVGRNMAL